MLQTSAHAYHWQPTIGARGAYQRKIAFEDIVETSAKLASESVRAPFQAAASPL
jgi:hypothetical protein